MLIQKKILIFKGWCLNLKNLRRIMKCTIGAPLCPIKAGADPRLLLSLMQGEYMPRGTRYSVTRTVIYSTMMAIRLTETDTGRKFTVRICTLCDVRCIRVVQKKYIYFGYWKYTKNSSLPLILIRKTCKAIGQDNRVIKTTPPMCRYGAVT